MIEEGHVSESMHRHFMGKIGDAAGPGIYVAGDPYSSIAFGETLIEVELEKGTKYIDLLDPSTLKALRKKGITTDQVLYLNPRAAIKYAGDGQNRSHWWVLKGREGIRFRPVDVPRIDVRNAQVVIGFLDASRAGKNTTIPPHQLRELFESAIPHIKSLEDGAEFLRYTTDTDYFKNADKNKNKVMDTIISQFTPSVEDKIDFLDDYFPMYERGQLNSANMGIRVDFIEKSVPHIQSAEDGVKLLRRVRDPELFTQIVSMSLSKVQSREDLDRLISESPEFRLLDDLSEGKRPVLSFFREPEISPSGSVKRYYSYMKCLHEQLPN